MNATNRYCCVNCQVELSKEEDYIAHYRSEHHRYNIKRKLIDLEPISLQDYQLRTFFPNWQSLRMIRTQRKARKRNCTVRYVARNFCLLEPIKLTWNPKDIKLLGKRSKLQAHWMWESLKLPQIFQLLEPKRPTSACFAQNQKQGSTFEPNIISLLLNTNVLM